MLPINANYIRWQRWLIVAIVPLLVFIAIFAGLDRVTAVASSYAWGVDEPCVPNPTGGTCGPLDILVVTAGSPATQITFDWDRGPITTIQNLNPQYHAITRTGTPPGPQFDGGLSPQTATVKWGIDLRNHSQMATLTIQFNGYVTGFKLPIFDVDQNLPSYQDQLMVYGYKDLVYVAPILSSPNDLDGDAHDFGGNVVSGTKNIIPNSGSPTAAEGTVDIRFNEIIDRVVINYRSGGRAQANPNPQAVALGAPLSFTPIGPNAIAVQSIEANRDANTVWIALSIAFLSLILLLWRGWFTQ